MDQASSSQDSQPKKRRSSRRRTSRKSNHKSTGEDPQRQTPGLELPLTVMAISKPTPATQISARDIPNKKRFSIEKKKRATTLPTSLQIVHPSGLVTLLDELSNAFSRPLSTIDIPRLIRRLQIQTSRGIIHPRTQKSEQESVVRVIAHAIVAVVEHFEGSVEAAEVETATEQIVQNAEASKFDELETLTQDLFAADVVNPDSSSSKVFRQLSQSVVLCGMERLKRSVLKDRLTKDVRSEDGWTVDIFLGDKMCSVTHTRRERSIDFLNPSSYWEVTWEVCQTFDGRLNEMTAAFLRIVQFDMTHFLGTEAEKELLRRDLPAGLIVE